MSPNLRQQLAVKRRVKFKGQVQHRNLRIGVALDRGTPMRKLRQSGVIRSDESRQKFNYWKRKAEDPSFHSGDWGGARSFKFSDEIVTTISIIIWNFVHTHPMANFNEILIAIRMEGIDCRASYLRSLFKKWNWSWKMPVVQQLVSFVGVFCLSFCLFSISPPFFLG